MSPESVISAISVRRKIQRVYKRHQQCVQAELRVCTLPTFLITYTIKLFNHKLKKVYDSNGRDCQPPGPGPRVFSSLRFWVLGLEFDSEAKMLSLQSFLRKGVSLGHVGRN